MSPIDELKKITPEEFERLDLTKRFEMVACCDEYVREWWVRCPRCGFRMTGKLKELRGKPCGACGYGG